MIDEIVQRIYDEDESVATREMEKKVGLESQLLDCLLLEASWLGPVENNAA